MRRRIPMLSRQSKRAEQDSSEFTFFTLYRVLALLIVVFYVIIEKAANGASLYMGAPFIAFAIWNIGFLGLWGRPIFRLSRRYPWLVIFETVFAFFLSITIQPIFSPYLVYTFMPIFWLGLVADLRRSALLAVFSAAAYAGAITLAEAWQMLFSSRVLIVAFLANNLAFFLTALYSALPMSLIKRLRVREEQIMDLNQASAKTNEKLKEDRQTLKMLNRMGLVMQNTGNQQTLEKIILELLMRRFDLDWAGIIVFDKTSRVISRTSQIIKPELDEILDLSKLRGHKVEEMTIASQAFERNSIVVVGHESEADANDALSSLLHGHSYAVLPLRSGDRKIGALITGADTVALTDESLSYIKILSAQLGISYSSIEIESDHRALIDKLLSMNNAIEQIAAHAQVSSILENAVNLMKSMTKTQKAIITLIEESSGELLFDPELTIVRGSQSQCPDFWWKTQIAQNSERLLSSSEPFTITSKDYAKSSKTSIVCLPIAYRLKTCGLMAAIFDEDHFFEQSDIIVLSSLARFTAVAIENYRLLERTQQLTLVNERTRIAEDMHDGLAQSLFSLVLGIEVCSRMIDSDPQVVKERLHDLQSMTSATLREVRQYIYDLRPGSLDELGLAKAIESFVLEFKSANSSKAFFDLDGEQYRLPPETERSLYLIGREAIVNATKYSGTDEVRVRLAYGADQVALTIEDDGIGFDVDRVLRDAVSKGNLGLSNMHERAKRCGGVCRIESYPGQGVKVIIQVPRVNPSSHFDS